MPRFMLTIAYDGTEFCGWQKQEPPGAAPLRTVQGVLEQAVREAVRQPGIEVTGASRTDSGVHAVGQVAAFTAETTIPAEKLAAAISARLPDDVQVRSASVVRDDFDPISHVVRKTYRYSIAHGGAPGVASDGQPYVPPLFDRHVVYSTWYRLETAQMNQAARHFVGAHDFVSFAQIEHGRSTTVRTIFDCSVTATAPDRCFIEVTGSGFLYNMVRIIAGTLVEVGRGRIASDRIPVIIDGHDRRAAGPTLPPEGLCLMSVEYPPEVLAPSAAAPAEFPRAM